MTTKRIFVRATVHLANLSPGQTAWVDPSDRYIQDLLEVRYLEPEDPPEGTAPAEDTDGSAGAEDDENAVALTEGTTGDGDRSPADTRGTIDET